jgi:hypothetical protein
MYWLGLQILFGAAVGTNSDPSLWTTAKLGGRAFTNKGLVGFGYIPATARDSYGETLGQSLMQGQA